MEIYLGKKEVYGNIQEIFYATLTDRIVIKPDIWKDNVRENYTYKEEIVCSKYHSYFVINTSVGVGAKGKNNIDQVHIRFRLVPMDKDISIPEVVGIYPYSISQTAGERTHSERTEKGANVNANANASYRSEIGIDTTIGGGSKFNKNVEDKIDYTLPYHVTIANASGTGNRAMWEFYQEKGMAAVGQFDLKIFFRILNGKPALSWPSDGIIRDLYCMDWNVEVNRQRLVDSIKSILKETGT